MGGFFATKFHELARIFTDYLGWFLLDKSGEAGFDNQEVRNEKGGFCSIYGEAFQSLCLASTRQAMRQVLCWEIKMVVFWWSIRKRFWYLKFTFRVKVT